MTISSYISPYMQCYLPFLVVTAHFQQAVYTVAESDQLVSVCVLLDMAAERVISLSLNLTEDTVGE